MRIIGSSYLRRKFRERRNRKRSKVPKSSSVSTDNVRINASSNDGTERPRRQFGSFSCKNSSSTSKERSRDYSPELIVSALYSIMLALLAICFVHRGIISSTRVPTSKNSSSDSIPSNQSNSGKLVDLENRIIAIHESYHSDEINYLNAKEKDICEKYEREILSLESDLKILREQMEADTYEREQLLKESLASVNDTTSTNTDHDDKKLRETTELLYNKIFQDINKLLQQYYNQSREE